MDKLLPCPFCGGEAAVRDIEKPSVNGWIGCQRCRCFMDFVKNGKPLAIAAWNRRAQPENKPLTCKGCVYWKDRQVQLRDGSCRDYLPNELWSVTADVGINVASHCTLHGFDNESGSWFWAKAEDFCSRGIRKPERSEG